MQQFTDLPAFKTFAESQGFSTELENSGYEGMHESDPYLAVFALDTDGNYVGMFSQGDNTGFICSDSAEFMAATHDDESL